MAIKWNKKLQKMKLRPSEIKNARKKRKNRKLLNKKSGTNNGLHEYNKLVVVAEKLAVGGFVLLIFGALACAHVQMFVCLFVYVCCCAYYNIRKRVRIMF